MHSCYPKSIAVCFLLCAAIQAKAGPAGDFIDDFRRAMHTGKAGTFLDVDNDTLLLKRDDRFYTSGLRITRKYVLPDNGTAPAFGWRIGQELYTASDIKLAPEKVVPPDHPYAAWLYGGVFGAMQLGNGMHVNLGLDLGCLGPCAGGERTQKTLHRIIDQPMPQAWSKQVRNEVGAVLYADVVPVRWMQGPSLDLTPALHARFGNIFSDAGAGITLRAGTLNQQPGQAAAYGFVRVDGRAVAYNATLQGGYFSDGNPHTVKPKRVVGEVELGLVWSGAEYGLHLSIIRRGNEIDGLSNAIGGQSFARLQFSYTP